MENITITELVLVLMLGKPFQDSRYKTYNFDDKKVPLDINF